MKLKPLQLGWVEQIEAAGLRMALFAKQGCGKTPTILEVMKRNPTVWYVVTRKSFFPTWVREIHKWLPEVSVEGDGWGGSKYGLNYSNRDEDLKLGIRSMDKDFDAVGHYGVVVDESYYVKGYTSQRHKNLRSICDKAQGVILANGDPYTTSVMDIWGQMRLVLGPDHYDAAEMRRRYFAKNLQGFGMEEYPEAAEMYKKHPDVQAHSIWHHPPSEKKVKHIVVNLKLDPKQATHYDSIKKDMETEVLGERQEYKHAMEKMMKLHQICGGCLPYFDESNTPCLGYLPSPKLMWLLVYLRNYKGKVVIWCMYRHEVKRIAAFLASWGIDCGTRMGGGTDRTGIGVMAATLDMGVSTNVFSQFPVAIYYSENYKFFLRSQSRYRIDRADSLHKSVTYYYLQMQDTIDTYIYEQVRQRGITARKLFNPKTFLSFKS